MMSRNLNNVAVLHKNGVDYRCIISGICESEVVKLLKNADLTEKVGHYKI